MNRSPKMNRVSAALKEPSPLTVGLEPELVTRDVRKKSQGVGGRTLRP